MHIKEQAADFFPRLARGRVSHSSTLRTRSTSLFNHGIRLRSADITQYANEPTNQSQCLLLMPEHAEQSELQRSVSVATLSN